eukprot:TRINITY_DN13154_c3_g1_i1.p1 TRINITY_DN13154_c3_g1~~TRINITY_DN13154_c3_g1_i1.p1  ORF type:complete len:757 (+),score=115.93 TRINITY_DN13154_c3_g1_i1:66-2336(+)
MAKPVQQVQSKSIGHYVLMKTIGEGTFGKVKLGTHILTGERVAVKVLEKGRIVDSADVERVAREIHILKLIRHPHIIQLYEIIETPRQLYLIMEYACGGELFDYIVEHVRAEEPEACRFLHQILAGVERVHQTGVVHRDLKPENLLLDERNDIKIVDFGLSNTFEEGQLLQTACGSPCYASPEMIAGHRYVPHMVDIWSCGVILFALVCGYLPFEVSDDQNNHAELYKKILNAEYEMPDFVSTDVADLIRGMLTTDPEKRLTLKAIREHNWYKQIPEAAVRMNEVQNELDQEIIDQLDSYGFSREHAVKCLQSNKHNHVTTTYYLLKEKKHLQQNDAGVKAAAELTDAIVADLNAAGFEDLVDPDASFLSSTQASTSPTHHRGENARNPNYFAGRRQRRGGPLPAAGFGGAGNGPADVRRQAEPEAATINRIPAAGFGASSGSCSGRPPSKTAFGPTTGDFDSQDIDCKIGGSGGSGRCSTTAVLGDGSSGSRPLPTAQFGGYPYAVEQAPRAYANPGQIGSARSVSPGLSPYRGRDYRSRPHSARCGAGPRRTDFGAVGCTHNQRSISPYGHSYRAWGGGRTAGPPLDDNPEPRMPAWRAGAEARLTARSRQQDNSGADRDRSANASSSAFGACRGGKRGASALSAPRQEEGLAQGQRGCVSEFNHSGPMQVSCRSMLPPRQIVQELLRCLTAQRVAHRHVSSFLIRCQTRGFRMEAEVAQMSSGGDYMLRFSWVSGDIFKFKEVCAQLLSDMGF